MSLTQGWPCDSQIDDKINTFDDYLEKSGLSSDLQFCFRSSHATADLFSLQSADRIAWNFYRPGATRFILLAISKTFDRLRHAVRQNLTKKRESTQGEVLACHFTLHGCFSRFLTPILVGFLGVRFEVVGGKTIPLSKTP